jgi:MFS family permease
VFLKVIESEFGLTRGGTSGIFSLYMLLCCIFAVAGGWILDRYGPKIVVVCMGFFTGLSFFLSSQATAAWQLYITYGVLFALGTGALFTVINSTTSRWFEKKRGLALGVTTSGTGVGTIVMAPLATFLITTFSWRAAFIVIGIMAWFIITLMGLALKKDPRTVGLLPDGEKRGIVRSGPKDHPVFPAGLSLLQSLQTGNFWFLNLAWLFLSLNVHLFIVHVVPYATDMGIAPMEAALIVSLAGGATIAGRLGIGAISDATGRKIPAIACALLQTGSLLWLLWAGELWVFYTIAVVFGLLWGGLSTMIMALIGDVFGLRSIGVIMGVMSAGWSLGAATGPAIGGFIFDMSGYYSTAFVIGAGAMFITTFLVSLVNVKKHQVQS